MATMTVRIASLNTALLDTFREETTEGLDRIESRLLELVTRRDPALIDELFRVVHTIKGGAGTFGMMQMMRVAHRMESVLDLYRAGAQPTRDAVNALLQGCDALRRLLAGEPSQPDRERALELLLEQAAAAASGAAAAEAKPPAAGQIRVKLPTFSSPAALVEAPVTADPAEPVVSDREPASLRHTITLAPAAELFRSGIDPVLLFDQLTALGELSAQVDLSAVPPLDQLDPMSCHLRWKLTLLGSDAEVIRSLFSWFDELCPIDITTEGPTDQPAVAPTPPPPQPAAPPAAQAAPAIATTSATTAATIRVRLDKLDALMALVAELVVTQSTLAAVHRSPGRGGSADLRANSALDELERLTRSLHQSALQLRSMPISSVLDRFPRLVHDLAAKLGKDIALEVGGDSIELDKTVLERIGDPLVHLIRNSIDHGIEPPDVREAAGKPRTGRIQLAVEQRGDEVLLELSDDGRGLDPAKILGRARERGLVPAGRTLTDDEIYHLIFLPGFSTAEQVSELSGRGVGMDVVIRTIQELGGDVQLRSQLGAGTTIALRLPLTLAIIEGQIVRFAGRAWIVPLSHIVECSQLDPAAVTVLLGQRPVYRIGDDVVPMLDLCERLALPRQRPGVLVLIVEAGGQRRALTIDEVGPRQQVVIKSLSAQLARTDDIAGASVLGDGSVAFILDIVSLCASERSAD